VVEETGVTDYKAIADYLGEPYFVDELGDIGKRIIGGEGYVADQSDADLVISVLEKLKAEGRSASLVDDSDGGWACYADISEGLAPTPIEAISALVVAMKESA
jgi:hypothetical protein